MHTQRQIDYLQAQRASEWLEILKRGDAQDMAAFREWCRKSPLHIQEFLELTCTDQALDELDYGKAETTEDLTALLREASKTPQALLTPINPVAASRSSQQHQWRWALAAAVAVLAVGVFLYQKPWSPAGQFSTKIGEQRTVELTDSSVVTLNTNSDIAVQFNGGVRNIELRRGEAVFKVAHDPQRPFRVHTRAGTVQAIGTEFNVYDRPDGIEVTVLDGRVRLTSNSSESTGTPIAQELVAGEEARIALDGSIQRLEHTDIARVTAWSKRRLTFHNEALEEMVLEFNRYHRNPRLRLENVPADSRHYSGIFDADDPETLARFLERESDLVVERSRGEIVIRQDVTEEPNLP